MEFAMTLRPMRLTRFLALPALTLGLAAGASGLLSTARPTMAAPEPSPVPKRWELSIQPGPLRTAVVNTDAGPRAYFYMTYKVINNGTQDLLFAPTFELATDETGDPLRSGRDVPVAVTRAIVEMQDNQLLEDQISVVGTILRGPENAKESVAIWPVPQMKVSELSVYAGGFSGENATLELPDASGKVEKKILRKTYMMRFRMPGELSPGDGTEFKPFESRWIMR
jgi:hypothetical protein